MQILPPKQNQNKVHFITIEAERAGQRLDNFLKSRYKDLPKSRLYRLIRKGEVRVNKKRCDPDYRLLAEDVIRMPPLMLLDTPDEAPKTLKISDKLKNLLEKNILHEDRGLIIFNKPSGMAVHGGSGVQLGVIEAFRLYRPKEKYLELVHRLDRETSGCLLISKKPSVLRECHRLLRERGMTKRYCLLVKGRWPKRLQHIDEALDKNHLQGGERIVRVARGGEGKASRTIFKIKQVFSQTTFLEAEPETGRTHQIRVHALHAGHPIVGDDKYGDKSFNKLLQAYGCKRLFLHAHSLEFDLPDENTGHTRHIAVTAPLDADLARCLTRLEKQDKA